MFPSRERGVVPLSLFLEATFFLPRFNYPLCQGMYKGGFAEMDGKGVVGVIKVVNHCRGDCNLDWIPCCALVMRIDSHLQATQHVVNTPHVLWRQHARHHLSGGGVERNTRVEHCGSNLSFDTHFPAVFVLVFVLRETSSTLLDCEL